ncbi:hypothetical protein CAEBREN_17223 [Caenorhabditis brenneri]|uniref:Uncharacterized protein n=1 Tax=Caenorhabditis brenneri TaxID=135651 RepID=G0P829_CAEBE|nr:hypothetical protein CAEBREN_17223 [Caenorhabditis brenneri]
MAEYLLRILNDRWNQSNIDYVLHVSKSASEQLEKWLKNKQILEELRRPGAICPGNHPDLANLATACLAHKIKQMTETVETNKTDYMGFGVFILNIEKRLTNYGMAAVEYTDHEQLAKKREEVFEEMQRVGQFYIEIRDKIHSVPWAPHEDGFELLSDQESNEFAGEIVEFLRDAERAQRNFEEFVRSVIQPVKNLIEELRERQKAAQLLRTPIIVELVEDITHFPLQPSEIFQLEN